MGVLGVSITMGLYYWFARLRFGYSFSGMLSQPLCAAMVAGLATGKIAEAMIIGAGIQLVYLGVTSTPGGNVPSDPALASAIAIPIALGVGMNAEAAIALAVPFGVLGVFMDQLRRTVNATWIHMADKYAEELNYQGIYRAAFIYPALAGFLIRFPLVFAANFFGQSVVTKILEIIPATLMHGFEVMGGMLPALGFALTLMVIGKKELLPYFFIGFVAVIYFGAEVMAVAILGVCVAFLVRNLGTKEEAV